MAETNMVELLIKIPEEVKNRLCFGVTYPKDIQVMCEALNNSTPLPKGHGRLIDADALYEQYAYADCNFDMTMEYAPTIIEADKGEGYEPDDWDSLANAERDH